MGSGFIINGTAEQVDGLIVQNFIDNPRLRLAPDDQRPRTAAEQRWVRAIVLHTTGGIPGGKSDPREQSIIPGFGRSSRAGERIVADWTHDHSRPGGAHLIVDFDGLVYCCADLIATAAYHASDANGVSVGIEIVQAHDGSLFDGQLGIAVRVVDWLTARLGIQRQMPSRYDGRPIPRLTGYLKDTGVFGHRHVSANRWKGDPGDAIFDKLRAAGYEAFDFELGQDVVTWKQRQAALGIAADGVPGRGTRDALLAKGKRAGLWVERP
jgi:hypothetical protein